jgi:uncharacterized damage-inducible protein DinB
MGRSGPDEADVERADGGHAAAAPSNGMAFSLELGTEVLRRTPDVLHTMLSGLAEQWVMSDEGPGTWSSYQVVGHLTHVEECDWIDRTRVILEHGADHVFDPVDREAGFLRFDGWSLDDLLDRFASVRRSNLASLEALVGDDDLERKGTHPDFGEVTIRELLSTWVVHDLNHVGQIVKTMAKQYTRAVGPWRAFLPIIDAS